MSRNVRVRNNRYHVVCSARETHRDPRDAIGRKSNELKHKRMTLTWLRCAQRRHINHGKLRRRERVLRRPTFDEAELSPDCRQKAWPRDAGGSPDPNAEPFTTREPTQRLRVGPSVPKQLQFGGRTHPNCDSAVRDPKQRAMTGCPVCACAAAFRSESEREHDNNGDLRALHTRRSPPQLLAPGYLLVRHSTPESLPDQ